MSPRITKFPETKALRAGGSTALVRLSVFPHYACNTTHLNIREPACPSAASNVKKATWALHRHFNLFPDLFVTSTSTKEAIAPFVRIGGLHLVVYEYHVISRVLRVLCGIAHVTPFGCYLRGKQWYAIVASIQECLTSERFRITLDCYA